jgi:methyl-accepting chemotaxis protein
MSAKKTGSNGAGHAEESEGDFGQDGDGLSRQTGDRKSRGSRRTRIPWYRRQYVVNREMQSKYAWSGVLIGLASSALSAGMLLWAFWSFNIWQGQRLPRPVIVVIGVVLLMNAGGIYVATVLSTQRIAGPLFNLLKQFQRVAGGALDTRATFRKGDELHYVGSRFNEMMNRLEDREEKIFAQVDAAEKALQDSRAGEAAEALRRARELRKPLIDV